MTRVLARGGAPFRGLVVCPKCKGRADALFRYPAVRGDGWLMPRYYTWAERVTCPRCGYAAIAEASRSLAFDLWLKAPCRGREVWAFCVEHLRGIERFLDLGGTWDDEPAHPASCSDLHGLPEWMHRHRAEVKKCLAKLQDMSTDGEP